MSESKERNIIMGFNFEDIRNIPISDGAKNIISLGKKLNAAYSEETAIELYSAISEFSFILPVQYDGDIKEAEKAMEEGLSFPIREYGYKLLNKKKIIPIFTCYGEMVKTLSKMNILEDYNQVLVLDVDYINWLILQVDADGVVIDADGAQVFNYD